MRKLRSGRGPLVAAALTVAIAGSGAAAYAAASSGGTASSGEQVATVAPGPERELRAYGLSGSEDAPVFTLADGQSVGVVSNGAASCLVRRSGAEWAGETCATTAAIAEGHGVSVSDECGSTGKNLMEIMGLAPEGVAAVVLLSSDGTSQRDTVLDGAFKFDGTNPATGGPYPTGVQWLGSNGSAVGTAPLPVNGEHFCLPTS
jgi:hypothetical protein